MSDFTSSLSLLLADPGDSIGAVFDLAVDEPSSVEYSPGKLLRLVAGKSMVGRTQLGRVPDVVGYFADGSRGTPKSHQELQGEIGVVLRSFIASESVTAGWYHIGGVTYFLWDHRAKAATINSHVRSWETPESRRLRHELQEAGIAFRAEKMEGSSRPWQGGISVRGPVADHRHGSEVIWSRLVPGALELACRAGDLGYRLDVGRVFSFPYSSGPVVADIAGIEGLLEEFSKDLNKTTPELGLSDYWADTIVGLLTVLIVSGRPRPRKLSGSEWDTWFAEAHRLAETVRVPSPPMTP